MKTRTWIIIGIGIALMIATYNEKQKKDSIWEFGADTQGNDISYETWLQLQGSGTAGLAAKNEKKSIWPVFLVGGIILALFITGWSLLQNTWFMMISAGILVLAVLMR